MLLTMAFRSRPLRSKKQFGKIDAGFLSWDFDVWDGDERLLGRVDKDWAGLAREVWMTGEIVALSFGGRRGGVWLMWAAGKDERGRA
jgi:hypothetical protein